MNENNSEYGEWLRLKRESAGLTQHQLAAELGCSIGTIGPIESGHRAGSAKLRRKIADYFNDNSGVAITTLKTTHTTGIEHLKPILKRLAKITLDPDYKKRVQELAGILKRDEETAAVMYLENAITN